MTEKWALLIPIVLSSCPLSWPDTDAPAGPFDCVIANGRVVDPESKMDAVRNIGIKDGKIVAVSEGPLPGKEQVDATGLIVSAGFIDLHSHAQTIAGMRMQAYDGVTTALELEAGSWPTSLGYQVAARQGHVLNSGFSSSWAMARMTVTGGIKSDGTLATFNRGMAAPGWGRFATLQESERVLSLVEQGLREGGLGIGVLLGYGPESNIDEYFAVARLAKRFDAPVFTHI